MAWVYLSRLLNLDEKSDFYFFIDYRKKNCDQDIKNYTILFCKRSNYHGSNSSLIWPSFIISYYYYFLFHKFITICLKIVQYSVKKLSTKQIILIFAYLPFEYLQGYVIINFHNFSCV